MPLYRLLVTEVIAKDVEYSVEAKDEAEAQRKAQSGDTFHEEHWKDLGCVDRHIVEGPSLIVAEIPDEDEDMVIYEQDSDEDFDN